MAEAGLGEWDSWRCCNEPNGVKMFCPPEGCPKSFGCARDQGWLPGRPTPNGCKTLPAQSSERGK